MPLTGGAGEGGGNQRWVVSPAGDGLWKPADSQDRRKLATATGRLDAKGDPLVELAAGAGAPAQQWRLTKLGIVHLHG
ncbi:hypothetical protein ABTX81_08330 [Kitasatospora sp. NPDC097605]|uniref:hypothetical protein n=1 Tax=Kitasatospora sp. NPDC097605 TaxID=3157226 RepID=UPI00331CA137